MPFKGSSGHPTGRRVTFINSFAIKGQSFNFSTAGPWLWDEITVGIPAGAAEETEVEMERPTGGWAARTGRPLHLVT